MTLVSILIALALDRILLWHRDAPVARAWRWLVDAIARRLPTGWEGMGAVIAIILPGALVVALLQWLVSGWLFGLLSLILGVVVLLFALGPLDVVSSVDEYIEARDKNDTERSDFHYASLTGETRTTTGRDGDRIVGAILHQVHDHFFATVFWFCVLGPLGAALYRLSAEAALQPPESIASRPALARAARDAAGVLGWIPARLLALGYALTGSFEAAMQRLRMHPQPAGDWLTNNQELLAATGSAALAPEDAERTADGTQESGHAGVTAASQVAAARALVMRTVILWLAVLALLTLVGWLT